MWIVLAIVFALGVGAGGVYYWQNQKLNDQQAQNQSQQALLNAQISTLQQQINAKPAATPTTTPTTNDQTDIKAAVKSDCDSDVSTKSVAVTGVKVIGSFATASDDCPLKTVSHNVYTATLKKVDGRWVVLYVGHNPPPSSIRSKYGIPANVE